LLQDTFQPLREFRRAETNGVDSKARLDCRGRKLLR
jgi:hypothetical protein